LWRMQIEILREIHRSRFAKRGRRFGSDVELMIVYGAATLYYGLRTPVRALPISRYLEMPRETVRRHMGRLVALVCLNAQRIKPSCPPRNSVSLRLSGFYACFARELADYCDYPVVRRIAVNFAKLPNLLLSGQGREF